MCKVRTQLLATVAAVALSGSAYAASPVSSWTGFYLGGNVGVAQLNAKAITSSVNPGPAGNRECSYSPGSFSALNDCSLEAVSATAGFQGGYDWQVNNVVVGVAADWSWTNLSATNSLVGRAISNPFVTAKVDWMASFRGRIGWAWDSQTLLYATGGWALAGIKASEGSAAGCCETHTTAINTTKGGWVVGGGLEHKLTEHVSFMGELLYYNFGSTNSPVASTVGQAFTYQTDFSQKVFQARVGMNYKF